MDKKCNVCLNVKSTDEFYKTRGSLFPACKTCTREKNQETARRAYYQKRFGIMYETYTWMLAQQEFKCAICKTLHQEKPDKKWGRARLAVDHSHKTGIVRALLCHSCNVALGLMKESPEQLRAAADYLESFHFDNLPTSV